MKNILTVSVAFFITIVAYSQNYQKLKVPSLDASGAIKDRNGSVIGYFNKEDVILKDKNQKRVAHFDAFSNLIMDSTETNICKTDLEGNMTAILNKKFYSWKTFFPEPGVEICLVREKNLEGNIVGSVNKRFKQYGSSVIFCMLYLERQLNNSDQLARKETIKEEVKQTEILKTNEAQQQVKEDKIIANEPLAQNLKLVSNPDSVTYKEEVKPSKSLNKNTKTVVKSTKKEVTTKKTLSKTAVKKVETKNLKSGIKKKVTVTESTKKSKK